MHCPNPDITVFIIVFIIFLWLVYSVWNERTGDNKFKNFLHAVIRWFKMEGWILFFRENVLRTKEGKKDQFFSAAGFD